MIFLLQKELLYIPMSNTADPFVMSTHFFVYRCQNGCQSMDFDSVDKGIWKVPVFYWGIPDNNI